MMHGARRTDRDGPVGRGDRGATLITFALSIVAICAVIALVLGGSLGYDAERNSQTSSDSAALAATSALRAVQTSSPAPTSAAQFDVVYDTAETMAKANGANSTEKVGCELVAADGSTIEECEAASLAEFTSASGVRVGTRDTRDVPFGEANNLTTISGVTGAAATIQPLRAGNSPFLVCSSSGGADGHPVKVLEDTAPYNINSAAIGEQFLLWGEDVKEGDRQCGGSSNSWRGWVDNSSGTHELPGWWGVDTGSKNGHLVPRLLIDPDGCDAEEGADIADLDGCVIAVPLCTHSNNASGSSLELYCVRFGSFRLAAYSGAHGSAPCQRGSDNANKVLCGEFLGGGAIATGGQGSSDQASVDDVVLIKLVE